jgi:hypothetical protein
MRKKEKLRSKHHKMVPTKRLWQVTELKKAYVGEPKSPEYPDFST